MVINDAVLDGELLQLAAPQTGAWSNQFRPPTLVALTPHLNTLWLEDG